MVDWNPLNWWSSPGQGTAPFKMPGGGGGGGGQASPYGGGPPPGYTEGTPGATILAPGQVDPATGMTLEDLYNSPGNAYARNQQIQTGTASSLIKQLTDWTLASDPGMRALDQNNALLNLQGGMSQIGFDQQTTALRQDTKNALAKLGISMEGVKQDKANAQQQIGFANRQYGLSAEGANQAFDSNLRGLYSDATARGGVTTGGTREHRGDLQKQLMNQMQGFDLTKDRDIAGANRAMAAADLQAKGLGIDRQTYMDNLNQGLQQIGLARQVDSLKLIEAANSNDAEKAAAAQTIIQNSLQLAQMNPALLQQIYQQNQSHGGLANGGGGGAQRKYF